MSVPKFYLYLRRSWRQEEHRKVVALGPVVFLVATYLKTSPLSNLVGIYHAPVRSIARATNLSEEEVKESLCDLERTEFCRYDFTDEYVGITGALASGLGINLSVSQIKGALKVLDCLINDEDAPFAAELREKIDGDAACQEKILKDKEMQKVKKLAVGKLKKVVAIGTDTEAFYAHRQR